MFLSTFSHISIIKVDRAHYQLNSIKKLFPIIRFEEKVKKHGDRNTSPMLTIYFPALSFR